MTPGDTISRYRILGPLGKGGMGVVYEAEDTRLHRPVALKFLPRDSLTGQGKLRFLNEARAAALIRHPNICPIYDIEEADGEIFIVMARLEGETLSRKIAKGTLDIGAAIAIAIQIAEGLEAAHELGVVHRDIKSSNIIVGPDGHASILDFGLALRLGETRLTGAGHAVGTPTYMSPEQARGSEVDRRTDIWSLGVVLFEMVTGSVPFDRDHATAVVHAILSEKVPAAAPPPLQNVIETALAKHPDRRWQHARDMAAELRKIAASDVVSTQTLDAGPVARSRKGPLALAGLALVLMAAGLGYYKFRARPPAIVQSIEKKQVAVLPFQVIGADEGARNTSDGLVEILTAALSDFERFEGKIVAVPASEIRRRGIASAEEARRVYGVNFAISGSAQSAGGKLQLTMNLVDAVHLRQIASKTLEYDPAKATESKNRAIDQMARLLGFDLTPAESKVVTAGDTATPGAYGAYLEGRGLLSRYDVRGNIDKAIASFRRATELDPNYALAWSGLGEAYWRKTRSEGDQQTAALALESAERAVRLDPGLAIVHSVLGEVYGTSGREDDAIKELQKALQLAPGNAEAPRELARIYTNLGRFKEAEASYVQATKARPTDWDCHLLLGLFYYDQERYREAEASYRRAINLAPDNDITHRDLGIVCLQQGRYKDAVEELQISLRIKSNARTYMTLGTTYYYQHRFPEAVSALETAIDLDSNRYYYWGDLGIYYGWTPGHEAKATAALRRAVELGEKQLEVTPKDYDVRANLAEYRARLGDAKRSQAEIDQIPEPARRPRASRLAIAYELNGDRQKAIRLVQSQLRNQASLNQIKDDPDLAGLWRDPAFQKAIGSSPAASR